MADPHVLCDSGIQQLKLFWRAFSADGVKAGQMVFSSHNNLEKHHLHLTNLYYFIKNDLAK